MNSLSLVSLVSLTVELGSALLSAGTFESIARSNMVLWIKAQQENSFSTTWNLVLLLLRIRPVRLYQTTDFGSRMPTIAINFTPSTPYSASALSFLEIF